MAPRSRAMMMEPRPYKRWSGTLPNSEGPPTEEHEDTRIWTNDLLQSQNNRGKDNIGKSDSGGDVGGRFHTIKRSYYEWNTLDNVGARKFSSRSDPEDHTLSGTFYTIPTARYSSVTNNSFPTVTRSSSDALRAKGATAISRCIPTLPEFDGSVAVAELLREGLPSIVGAQSFRQRALTAKNAGSEYLNVEFGWKPLVADVKAFARTLQNEVELAQRLLDNSNKLLRRRFHFPLEEDVQIEEEGFKYPVPGFTSNHYTQAGKRTVTTVTRRHVWFSGSFQYYIAAEDLIGPGLQAWLGRAKHLYGVRLTPDVLWNLAPWSWLADWFANIGDVLTNISMFSSDRLAMPWAYVMEHKTIDQTIALRGVEFKSYPNRSYDFYQRFVAESKYRIPTSPYAIGLEDGTLTDRQKAIMGALIASRR